MKIEKINDNQIRCTLNKADLAERELKISELAYGTDKAKDLFREMMQQASDEFGFEAEGQIPLMIEAIPVSLDCIILVITKVEDPEELDTRFSKFAPSVDDTDDFDEGDSDDEITSLFQDIRDAEELAYDIDKVEEIVSPSDTADDFIPFKDSLKSTSKESSGKDTHDTENISRKITRIFSFSSLDKVISSCSFAKETSGIYSALYKDCSSKTYYLVLTFSGEINENFTRICNAVSEFGTRVKISYATESYYKEHFEAIIKSNALSVLSEL